MRAWLACCVIASGCYFQPSVLETPVTYVSTSTVAPDAVGCITHEPGGRHRVAKWWLNRERVGSDEIDRALAASPAAAADAARGRREERGGWAMVGAGATVMIGSLVAMLAWSSADPHSNLPLVMLAPEWAGGWGVAVSSMALFLASHRAQMRAVGEFNAAAALENRCPPASAAAAPVLPAAGGSVQPQANARGQRTAVDQLGLLARRAQSGDGSDEVAVAEPLHARGVGEAGQAALAADVPGQASGHIQVIGSSR